MLNEAIQLNSTLQFELFSAETAYDDFITLECYGKRKRIDDTNIPNPAKRRKIEEVSDSTDSGNFG